MINLVRGAHGEVKMNVHIKRLLLGIGLILVSYFPLQAVMEEKNAAVAATLLGFVGAFVIGGLVFREKR